MQHANLQYLSRLFQKISSKPTELYVVSRIWHQLNDLEIQMIPQQYVNLPEDKYALSDIFFPQVNVFVEINEPQHYHSDSRIELDRQRNEKIKAKTGTDVEVIDCREPLEKIHQQIDDIVKRIKGKVEASRMADSFKQWRPDISRDPAYWKTKGVLRVEDDVIMNNIEAICSIFDADFKQTKRGFLRKGAIVHPNLPGCVIWWPSAASRSKWRNHALDGGILITESNNFAEKNQSHYHGTIKSPHKRIVFYHTKDALGFEGYYFMGIYEIDFDLSNEKDGLFWRRVGTEIQL